ncbi:MAG: DUF2799 domain-containing protein [Synechococcaceae cyanobacterium SM1_2_3]|nr:DUF2799 domain-containing protein [Synechococcaceae cyanobacterium SM1_2_3]
MTTAKPLIAVALGLIGILAMGGCATLSKDECLMSDWYELGVQDGSAGHSPERLAEHRQACAEYRIRPDRQAYRAGWEEGIRAYCTPQRGFSEGRNGAGYAGVCPPPLERDFLRQYQIGRELHQQELRIQELERERERRKEEHRKKDHRKDGDRKQEDQPRSDDRGKPHQDSRRSEPPPTLPASRPASPNPPDPPAQPAVQGSQRRGKAPEEMQEAEEPHSRSRRQFTPDPTE